MSGVGRRLRRRVGVYGRCVLVLAALLLVCGACAKPKRPVLPAAVVTPKFPDYVYPAAPPQLGLPAAASAHEVGWQWLQSGELRNAEKSFFAVLKSTPQFYPSEAGLGFVGLARKDYRAAIAHFDRALAADGAYAPALAGRGEALLALGQRDQALASFEAAVHANPALTDLRRRIDVLRFRGMQDDVEAARRAAEAGRLPEAQTIYERSLAASPDSPFLYRELAIVERRIGNLEAALGHALKATELAPAEPRNFITLGEVYEAQGAFAKAVEAYGTAATLEPSGALEARIDALREQAAFASMPEAYRAIEGSATVTRAQLAALLGVHLGDFLKRVPRGGPVLMTDTRGNWAAPWISSVTRAGLMEAFPNHTFQPDAVVRRVDLAVAASRALALIAAARPKERAAWTGAKVTFTDLPPGHLSYPAAAVAVQAGVMTAADDGSFQLARPVTGAEALAAVNKLETLAGQKPR